MYSVSLLHIAPPVLIPGERAVTTISRSIAKKQLQDRQRAWLQQVIDATKMKPAQIAREAGVSDTTLSRLLSNPEYSGTLSEVTIERIKTAYGIPGPAEGQQKLGNSLILAEGERLDPVALDQKIAKAIEALSSNDKTIEVWRLRSSALEGDGYFPGDLLLVEIGALPRPHDVICAMVTEWARGCLTANCVDQITLIPLHPFVCQR